MDMMDELELLRDDRSLVQLLCHYQESGLANPEAWQDRLMALPDREPRELTRLHGLLLAFGWLEQNTGLTGLLKPDTVACCYRITASGRRALRAAMRPMDEERRAAA